MDSAREIVLPQPDELGDKERQFASYAYLMMFASIGLGLPLPLINLGVSVGYWLYYRRQSDFISFHAMQSLLSQIPVTLLNASIFVSVIYYLFRDFAGIQEAYPWYIFVGAVNLAYVIYSVVGAVRAKQGRFFYFLFFGRAAFSIVFEHKRERSEKIQPRNEAPEDW